MAHWTTFILLVPLIAAQTPRDCPSRASIFQDVCAQHDFQSLTAFRRDTRLHHNASLGLLIVSQTGSSPYAFVCCSQFVETLSLPSPFSNRHPGLRGASRPVKISTAETLRGVWGWCISVRPLRLVFPLGVRISFILAAPATWQHLICTWRTISVCHQWECILFAVSFIIIIILSQNDECIFGPGCLGLTNLNWLFRDAYLTCISETENCRDVSNARILSSSKS